MAELASALEEAQRKGDLFSGRKQIPTFTRVRDEKVLGPIWHLLSQCVTRPLRPLPDLLRHPLDDDDIGQGLFSRGLSLNAVDELLRAIGRQRRLLRWYYEHGRASDRPTEHEVVAYMVLPMLLSLGWSEQLLAVEWHKVDLAAFRHTPTVRSGCVLVCEAKGVGHGLQDALEQAVKYVQRLSLENCRKIMLTQGGRFYLFERSAGTGNDGWDPNPSGYFNVENVRRRYLVPPDTDALETMMKLTPARIMNQ